MATTAAIAPREQTLRDLVDEGKKRAVLLLVFAFGLAFLMSCEFSEIRIQYLSALSFAARWDSRIGARRRFCRSVSRSVVP
jgi:sorting nexin-13